MTARREGKPLLAMQAIVAGDTPRHVAAAAYRNAIARSLLAAGANVHAKNRRGAESLHYAVDGGPGSPASTRTSL